MLSRKKYCRDLYDILGDLEFVIGDQIITILPRGYLHEVINDETHLKQPDGGPKKCIVGIEGIPDDANEFRFGTNFLRNFNVGLDFEKNTIHLEPKLYYSEIRNVGEEKKTEKLEIVYAPSNAFILLINFITDSL